MVKTGLDGSETYEDGGKRVMVRLANRSLPKAEKEFTWLPTNCTAKGEARITLSTCKEISKLILKIFNIN